MSGTTIPKPVLFGVLGVVLIAAAYFLVLKPKSDDSGSTTTTAVPAATPPPAKTTTTEKTSSKKSSSKSTAKQDKAAIKKTGEAYAVAAADGDGAAACALMTPAAQAETKELGALNGKASCEETIAAVAAKLPASAKEELRSVEVSSVTIDGDVATATGAGAQTVYFVKQAGGEWLYQGTTAPGGTSNKGGAKDPSTTATKPSTGTTDAAEQTTKVDPTNLPKNVRKALDADKIVTILFWRPQGVEDRDMQRVTGQLHKVIKGKDAKHFAVFQPGVGAITRWIKITGVEGVSQTPSYIVIGKGGKADVQTGFLDAGTMVNAIANDFRAFSAGKTALAKLPTN